MSKFPTQLTLQIDGVNAFNELHREPMLQACKERVPSFYRYAHAFYGAHQADMILCMDEPWPEDTPVPNGVKILGQEHMWISMSSEVGLTQGDALAMMLFCLTLQGPLERGDNVAQFPPRINKLDVRRSAERTAIFQNQEHNV